MITFCLVNICSKIFKTFEDFRADIDETKSNYYIKYLS